MMGGTAPATFAGALAQTNAEVLSGLVIHQAVKEGSPYIYGSMPSVFDMKSMIGTYGSPEFHLLVAAASELSHHYGLPFYGTSGCTDAKTLDYQAIMEVTLNSFTTSLSKANIAHDLGLMNHANFISPELVVLSNEIIDMLNVIRKGVTVDMETLALDVIREIGPGGHYLGHNHTFQHFKNIWYSDILDRSNSQNVTTLNEKIKYKTKQIIEEHNVETLPENITKTLNKYKANWKS